LSKLDAGNVYDGLILAAAGVKRLGWHDRISQVLPTLYAVGQGALGIEVREDDAEILELVRILTHRATAVRCHAERSLMRVLEGGCSVPLGVITTAEEVVAESRWKIGIKGGVYSLNGDESVEIYAEDEVEWDETGTQAAELGRKLAAQMKEKGAAEILKAIKQQPVTK
jgi:hydroxymethylbilane synthase